KASAGRSPKAAESGVRSQPTPLTPERSTITSPRLFRLREKLSTDRLGGCQPVITISCTISLPRGLGFGAARGRTVDGQAEGRTVQLMTCNGSSSDVTVVTPAAYHRDFPRWQAA